MNKFKLTLLAVAAVSSSSIKASSVMEQVFTDAVSFQTNSATTVNTPTRNGVSFGGASYRVKNIRTQPVSFAPPRLSGGCGGIDFFAGSFSVINSDQLVQMGRAIAQGVPSYAFNLALGSVCPSCSDLMQTLQNKLDEFNELTANGCEKSVAFLEGLDGGDAKSTFTKAMEFGALEKLADDTNGWLTDRGEALTQKGDTDNAANKAAKMGVDIEVNTAFKVLSSADVKNFTHDIPGLSGLNLRNLLMSLTGTVISQKSGNTNNNNSGITLKPMEPTVSLEDVFEGSDTGTIKIYVCTQSSSDPLCLNPAITSVQHRGLEQIFSETADRLGEKLVSRSSQAITNEEKALMQIANLNYAKVLGYLNGDRVTGTKILAARAQSQITAQLVDMISHLITVVKMKSNTGTDVVGSMSSGYLEELDLLSEKLKDLNKKYRAELNTEAASISVLKAMQDL
jgi:hypothetical protein